MLWEHEPQRSVSTAFSNFFNFFQTFSNFHECLYSSIETRSTCFLFVSETLRREKGKQLVNFDYQSVNSLCSRHHYVNSSRLFCVSIELYNHYFLTNQRACFLRAVFYNTIQYNTTQYNTIQYNTIQYNAMQCNAMQCDAIQYNTIKYNAMQCNAIQYNSIQFSTIQHNSIQYNT